MCEHKYIGSSSEWLLIITLIHFCPDVNMSCEHHHYNNIYKNTNNNEKNNKNNNNTNNKNNNSNNNNSKNNDNKENCIEQVLQSSHNQLTHWPTATQPQWRCFPHGPTESHDKDVKYLPCLDHWTISSSQKGVSLTGQSLGFGLEKSIIIKAMISWECMYQLCQKHSKNIHPNLVEI